MDNEKPSRNQQWQERSSRPVAARPMNKQEIEEYRKLLVRSYKCDDADIWFDFEKIRDENDEDRDDCLLLIYKMKCIQAGKPTTRYIFTCKLPIPEELRVMAEQLKKSSGSKALVRARPAAATSVPVPPQPQFNFGISTKEPTVEFPPERDSRAGPLPTAPPDEPQAAKPKLRRPVRKPK